METKQKNEKFLFYGHVRVNDKLIIKQKESWGVSITFFFGN